MAMLLETQMTDLPIGPPDQPEQTNPAPRRGRPPNGTRAATREPLRNGEWLGRDGEVLSRRRTHVSDPYQIPQELMDADWDLQWNTVTVVGSNEVVLAIENMMFDNGWRPVP